MGISEPRSADTSSPWTAKFLTQWTGRTQAGTLDTEASFLLQGCP